MKLKEHKKVELNEWKEDLEIAKIEKETGIK